MGHYTGIRFKGYVKETFRETFEPIALDGEWHLSEDKTFSKFGELTKSQFIPCGGLAYMPKQWEETARYGDGDKIIDYVDEYDNEIIYVQIPTDGFDKTYDKETGYWTFQCSLKNYDYEIQKWFQILPYFIERIEHLEYYDEGSQYGEAYDLVDGKIQLVNDEFVKYFD